MTIANLLVQARRAGMLASLIAAFTATSYSTTNLPLLGTDTDGDGLPDDLEIQFGSSPTVVDTDADGSSDYVEYFSGTNPRDKKSFPLFLNSVPPQQHLIGDTLVLRPINVTNLITYTNIEIVTIELPPDAPPDAPTKMTNITLFPTFAVYQWLRDDSPLPNQNNLELVLHKLQTNDTGLYRLSAAIDYITGFSTNTVVNDAGESMDVVVTNFAHAGQLGAPITAQTLPVAPKVRIAQPAGGLMGWGNNVYKQADVPTALTNATAGVIQAVGGRAHSAALMVNGTVVMWGTNDVAQLTVPRDLTNIVALAAGIDHTLALRGNGTVLAWGDNRYGQSRVPVGLTNVQSIGAGYFHSLALLKDGSVVAWGANESGQTNVPANARSIVQVVGGGHHTAALTKSGTVIAWGNTNNGRLNVPAAATNIVQLAAGDAHTVALTRNGDLIAWGENAALQTSIPINLGKILSIAAGDSYSAAVTADGRVRIVGTRGALFADASDVLTKIPTVLRGTNANALTIASGFFHVLALVVPPDSDCDGLSDSFESLMGLNPANWDTDGDGVFDSNELRLGTNPLRKDTDGDGLPDLNEIVDGFDPTVATEVPDGTTQVSPALQLDLFTLGRGAYQLQSSSNRVDWRNFGNAQTPAKGWTTQLIDPKADEKYFRAIPPDPSALLALDPREAIGNNVVFGASDAASRGVPPAYSGLVQIAAGDWHTLGLRWDGTVVAWGLDFDGQATVPDGLTNVVAVAGGGQHSLALQGDGTVVAWGRNNQGQTSVPSGLPAVQAISAGSDFSVALLASGRVAAWGANANGQLTVPTTLGTVRQLDAGFAHVIALSTDGRVVCWGDNGFGQCNVPANLGPVSAVAAGDLHSLALRADGSVVCWGNNSVGQCTPPAGLTGVVKIDAGFRDSVALTADGTVVAWGEGGSSLTPPDSFHRTTQINAGGFAIYAVKNLEDADADLVDDSFEVINHTNPQNQDTDGDGLTDGLERIYGFDPNQPDAAPEPTLAVRLALKLTFFTLSAGQYRLDTTTDFATWTSTGTVINAVRGYSSVLRMADPNETRYFRLVRLNKP